MAFFLSCDVVDCDHREDVDDILESDIGKPCPKCGANLLTAEDFEVFDKQFKPAMEMMKTLGLLADPGSGADGKLLSINYHAGTTTIVEGART